MKAIFYPIESGAVAEVLKFFTIAATSEALPRSSYRTLRMAGDVGERHSWTVHGLLLKRVRSVRRAPRASYSSRPGSNSRATSGSIARQRTGTRVQNLSTVARLAVNIRNVCASAMRARAGRTHEKVFVSAAHVWSQIVFSTATARTDAESERFMMRSG